jgi:hypothetical protein
LFPGNGSGHVLRAVSRNRAWQATTTKGYSAQTDRITGHSTSRAGLGKLPPPCRSQTNANK